MQGAAERSATIRERMTALLHAEPKANLNPRFEFRIGLCADYSRLLVGDAEDVLSVNQLLRHTIDCGRSILAARGGAGKTVVLYRLAEAAIEEGIIPVILDLKRWTPTDSDTWALLSAEARVNFLFDNFSLPKLTVSELNGLPKETARLVLGDGLNEVVSQVSREVLAALDDFVRYYAKTNVILTDRLVRRELDDRWLLSTILPFTTDGILRILGSKFDKLNESERELVATSYFLDSAREGGVGKNSSEVFNRYFLEHVSLTGEELSSASAGAYKLYETYRSRQFPRDILPSVFPETVLAKFAAAGDVLTVKGNACFFEHHLKHDYLVAHYLSQEKKIWTPDTLDTVTFFASSFDVLSMTFQEVRDVDDADFLFGLVYDWNLYGAAYAVTEGRAHEAEVVAISPGLHYVILAMLASRRWDIIEASRTKSEDAIRIFPAQLSKPFLAAKSLNDIFAILRDAHTGEKWFEEWKILFESSGAAQVDSYLLDRTLDQNPLIGWTLSNVLRRGILTKEQEYYVAEMLDRTEDYLRRWRIVHVLSCTSEAAIAERLLTILKDGSEHKWVRYGAVRSLIVIAANVEELRDQIVQELKEMASILIKEESTLNELLRCLFLSKDDAPENWFESVSPLVQEILERCETTEKLDRVKHLAVRLRATYAATAN